MRVHGQKPMPTLPMLQPSSLDLSYVLCCYWLIWPKASKLELVSKNLMSSARYCVCTVVQLHVGLGYFLCQKWWKWLLCWYLCFYWSLSCRIFQFADGIAPKSKHPHRSRLHNLRWRLCPLKVGFITNKPSAEHWPGSMFKCTAVVFLSQRNGSKTNPDVLSHFFVCGVNSASVPS